MKNKPGSRKKPIKPKKKPLSPKETISALIKLLEKDVEKAKLGSRLEHKIIRQLGKVLSEVHQNLAIFPSCKCYMTRPPFTYLGCISMANCYYLGATCKGGC